MDNFLKRFSLNLSSIKLAYLLGRDQGRKFLKGALIFPGIRIQDLKSVAARNQDSWEQLVAKREAMLEAVIDFVEEYVDFDED